MMKKNASKIRHLRLAPLIIICLLSPAVVFAQISSEITTIDPALLEKIKLEQASLTNTDLTNTIAPGTIIPLLPDTSQTVTPDYANTDGTIVDPNTTGTLTGRETQATNTTTDTAATDARTSGNTATDNSGTIIDTEAFRDLSDQVELPTLDVEISTAQIEETQARPETCDQQDRSCITLAEAEQAAGPGIISGQTKIAAIVLLSTAIGLLLTMLIYYFLNNFTSRRDLHRIQNDAQKFSRKFAAKEIGSNYSAVAASLSSIATADSFTTHDISDFKKSFIELQLSGSKETSETATHLISLLEGQTSDPGQLVQIKQTAEKLAAALKKELGQ